MSQPGRDEKYRRQYATNLAMTGLAGQVGCLTFLIVILSLVAGLWLDRVLDTRPLFTILLVLGSAPLALFITFRVAVRAAGSIRPLPPQSQTQPPSKEDEIGE
jgi:hypothetical protein